MADKRVSEQPNQEKLPPPQILWTGERKTTAGDCPCRVVLAYRWTLTHGASDWEAVPHGVYEVASRLDAMRQPQWEERPMNEVPAAFFESFIKR